MNALAAIVFAASAVCSLAGPDSTMFPSFGEIRSCHSTAIFDLHESCKVHVPEPKISAALLRCAEKMTEKLMDYFGRCVQSGGVPLTSFTRCNVVPPHSVAPQNGRRKREIIAHLTSAQLAELGSYGACFGANANTVLQQSMRRCWSNCPMDGIRSAIGGCVRTTAEPFFKTNAQDYARCAIHTMTTTV